jgi:hypothetical protein
MATDPVISKASREILFDGTSPVSEIGKWLPESEQ